MAVTIETIRKYNVPVGIPEDNIIEHIAKGTAERARRLGTPSYTGTKQAEYDEILIHLTLKRLYKYEDTFFVNMIPEEVSDLKTNARLHSPQDIETMINREEREATELIAVIAQEITTQTGEIAMLGVLSSISAGGNPDYIDYPENIKYDRRR